MSHPDSTLTSGMPEITLLFVFCGICISLWSVIVAFMAILTCFSISNENKIHIIHSAFSTYFLNCTRKSLTFHCFGQLTIESIVYPSITTLFVFQDGCELELSYCKFCLNHA